MLGKNCWSQTFLATQIGRVLQKNSLDIFTHKIYGTIVYVYLHEWLIFYGFHVGEYTSRMHPMV